MAHTITIEYILCGWVYVTDPPPPKCACFTDPYRCDAVRSNTLPVILNTPSRAIRHRDPCASVLRTCVWHARTCHTHARAHACAPVCAMCWPAVCWSAVCALARSIYSGSSAVCARHTHTHTHVSRSSCRTRTLPPP
jgi:hypothetical protein